MRIIKLLPWTWILLLFYCCTFQECPECPDCNNKKDTLLIIEKHFYQKDSVIREFHYYKSDSLVKIKYIEGQLVFPVVSYILIDYKIDSVNFDYPINLINLRDQIDSIFNLKNPF